MNETFQNKNYFYFYAENNQIKSLPNCSIAKREINRNLIKKYKAHSSEGKALFLNGV